MSSSSPAAEPEGLDRVPIQQFIGEYERSISRLPNGQWRCAWPDLPGAEGVGEDIGEAVLVGEQRLAVWLDKIQRLKLSLPSPGSYRQASGQMTFRTTRSLHARLVSLSAQTNRSLTRLCAQLLTAGISRAELFGLVAVSGCAARTANDDDFYAHAAIGSRESVEDIKTTGVWIQRISPELHFQLKLLADWEGVSLNLLMNIILSREVGLLEGLGALVQKDRRHSIEPESPGQAVQ